MVKNIKAEPISLDLDVAGLVRGHRALAVDGLAHGVEHAAHDGVADGHGDRLAVLFIDVDNFKQVNDSLGHHADDDLLKQVAERIERIRQLRPDMILIAGGTDGGTVTKVVEIAEIVSAL